MLNFLVRSAAAHSDTAVAAASACPGCGRDRVTATEFWRSAQHRLLRCGACGLVRLDSPRGGPAVESLYTPEYFHSYYVRTRERRLQYFTRWVARLTQGTSPGRLLDVGCGIGLFLAAAARSGWQGIGLEPSSGAAEFQEPGVQIVRGTLDSVDLPPGRFDLVTFWDVLAHLPTPHAVLCRARSLLAPGGRVLIKTPNRSAAFLTVAKALAPLGGTRGWLHIPAQVNHFSPACLAAIVEQAGFRVDSVEQVDEAVRSNFDTFLRHPKAVVEPALRGLLRACGQKEGLVLLASGSAG